MQTKPTDAELEILQVLWETGPSSVRKVNDILNESRDVGYTTTLKLLQIMHEKCLVSRNTASRSHIYTVLVSRENVQQHLLNKFLDLAFQGSASKLVMQLLGNERTSPGELAEIKALIREMENKKP